jgi:hypothetical protein
MSKRTRSISVIAILSILGGVIGIIDSIPTYSLYVSFRHSGVTVADQIQVEQVIPNSPAEEAHVIVGDKIVSVDGIKLKSIEQLNEYTETKAGQNVEMQLERNGTTQKLTLVPRINPPLGQGRVGLMLSNTYAKKQPIYRVIPQVLIMRYLGFEEKSMLFYSIITQDKSFTRLRTLFIGILSIIVGLGLWKLQKRAMYAYLLINAYWLTLLIPNFLTLFFRVNLLQSTSTSVVLFRGNWATSSTPIAQVLLYDFATILFSLLFAIIIFRNRRLFH